MESCTGAATKLKAGICPEEAPHPCEAFEAKAYPQTYFWICAVYFSNRGPTKGKRSGGGRAGREGARG
jgi:hypothetical protein